MIRIGCDIVSIERITKSYKKYGIKFLKRFLDEDEIALIKKEETIAGFWAAKEAIAKALHTGIGKNLSFLDIKILKINNVPHFIIKNKNFSIISSSLSIAHDGGFAIANAILILKDEENENKIFFNTHHNNISF